MILMMHLNFFFERLLPFFSFIIVWSENFSHFINKKMKWSWRYTELLFTRIFSHFLNFLQCNFYHFPSFFFALFPCLITNFSSISLIFFAVTTSFPTSFPISFAAYTPAAVLPLFLLFLYFALPLLFLLGNILDDTVLIETLAQS